MAAPLVARRGAAEDWHVSVVQSGLDRLDFLLAGLHAMGRGEHSAGDSRQPRKTPILGPVIGNGVGDSGITRMANKPISTFTIADEAGQAPELCCSALILKPASRYEWNRPVPDDT